MTISRLMSAVVLGLVFSTTAWSQDENFSAADAEKGIVDRFLLMGVEGIRDQMLRSGTPEENVDEAILEALRNYAECHVKEAIAQANAQRLDQGVVLRFLAGLPIDPINQPTIKALDLAALGKRKAPCDKKFIDDTR